MLLDENTIIGYCFELLVIQPLVTRESACCQLDFPNFNPPEREHVYSNAICHLELTSYSLGVCEFPLTGGLIS